MAGVFTWFGRNNIIKKNSSQKSPITTNTLIAFPTTSLSDLRSTFLHFIWARQRARIKHSLFKLPETKGGIGSPDLTQYYEATNVARILKWCSAFQHRQWIHLEQDFSTHPLRGLSWVNAPLRVQDSPTDRPQLCHRLTTF